MGGGQDSSAPTLDEECEDVTEDETLRQPGHADDRVRFCVRSAYDSAESHVDRCGEEGWRDEDEEGLNDVGRERFGMTVTDSTANVANEFNFERSFCQPSALLHTQGKGTSKSPAGEKRTYAPNGEG